MDKRFKSEILYTIRLDQNPDLSKTYLVEYNMPRSDKIKVKEICPISEQDYTTGRLVDRNECQTLLDTAAHKSFMSKIHCLTCKSLHSLPKLVSKTKNNQIGNGQYVSMLCIMPVILDIHDHIFEIFTLVLY